MQKKIFTSLLFLTSCALLFSLIAIGLVAFSQMEERFWSELKTELGYTEAIYEKEGVAGLAALKASERITLIDTSGKVLYDNQADAAKMDNHRKRPEVKAATASGVGRSRRESDTLFSKNFYYAEKMPNQMILRISKTQSGLVHLYTRMVLLGLLIFLILLVLAYFASRLTARRITRPINELDLQDPDKKRIYPEITPLVRRLVEQNGQIALQIKELKAQEEQFSLITTHMQEGLLLLDREKKVLFANPAARALFEIQQQKYRLPVQLFEQHEDFLQALSRVLAGQDQELKLPVKDRIYQLILNPVYQEKQVSGALVFLIDVTSAEKQAQLRREFTANVTHELRTPLTSISGYAEIIHAGLVQPADIPRFSGKIYDEAQRLIQLINDILKLSRLEQDPHLQEGEVFWPALLKKIAESLEPALEKKQQHLLIQGLPVKQNAFPNILFDMVYNLAENASKYSPDGTTITIALAEEAEDYQLRISDEGPGIPEKERERIFERFYRGDKSHSSQIPGTGLGLAIVKHGVQLHHGKIALEANQPHGSSFVIRFPKSEFLPRVAHDEAVEPVQGDPQPADDE